MQGSSRGAAQAASSWRVHVSPWQVDTDDLPRLIIYHLQLGGQAGGQAPLVHPPPMNSRRLSTLLRASSVSCRTSTGPIILYTLASSDSSFSSCTQPMACQHRQVAVTSCGMLQAGGTAQSSEQQRGRCRRSAGRTCSTISFSCCCCSDCCRSRWFCCTSAGADRRGRGGEALCGMPGDRAGAQQASARHTPDCIWRNTSTSVCSSRCSAWAREGSIAVID